jgi:predicted AAA+ superfamily ATPase
MVVLDMTWTVLPMPGYQHRVVDNELDALIPQLPAIALEGAKGVGKTASARKRSNSIRLLDDDQTLRIAEADPGRLLTGKPPVLIDEWQRLPVVWDLVRRAVDDDPTPGRFLLTGSASPTAPPTHSGAGRIVQVRMRPLSLAERGMNPTVSVAELLEGERPPVGGETQVNLEDYVSEILSGGFPAFRGLSPRALRAQVDGYLARVVDHDFPEMGLQVRRPETLMRWMRAYAAATSTMTSFDRIRDAATSGEGAKPAKTTTQPYRDILERLWLLDPLPSWLPSRNYLRRLTTAPKHHLADTSLAARLLRVGPEVLLTGKDPAPVIPRDGTLLGALFESLIALSLRVYAQAAEASVGHLRTRAGEREVDFIVTRDDIRVVAIEVKLSTVVKDSDVIHLSWLREQLGNDLLDAVVITTGREAYRRRDGIAVVPAALLGP